MDVWVEKEAPSTSRQSLPAIVWDATGMADRPRVPHASGWWSPTRPLALNVVMIGANVNEVPQGPPGDTHAFDAVTGKKLWEFHTVPRPGETGHETWLDDGWKNRSGVNVWSTFSVDTQTGTLLMPVGGPGRLYDPWRVVVSRT